MILIFIAVLCTSASSVFIRMSNMPPLVIALYRMTASAAFLSVPLIFGKEKGFGGITRRDLMRCVLSGTALALHFATWIASVSMTSVAASTVLVSCSPIFVAAAGVITTRKMPGWRLMACLAAAILGTVMVAWGGQGGQSTLLGNALALAGAFFVSIYLLIGQDVRKRVSTAVYAFIVYAAAAAALFAGSLILSQTLWPYPAREFGLVAAMAVVCSLGGHTLYNMLLKRRGAVLISLASLCEPVFASALAFLILGEAPGIGAVAGGAVVLGSLTVYILGARG
ncbi:MAG: DMT family transporter [Clostridiales bacterium]|jgi:drug/metabolite transporter (DMT)-like permease|nr:DMT family transporter [Clostridiales bacterium]